jgi:iron complex outermembrane receptor protein
MTNLKKFNAGVAIAALGLALMSAPAMADQAEPAAAAPDTKADVIIVTGSQFKQNAKTAIPVTTITTADLDKQGVSTIQDSIQRLVGNNGPALTNAFTANGAFAGGASGVSLRGLTTNSTLVLFDGMRSSYYPLADDGVRNFVDLNTIPDDVIERVEVLRDGASSLYGADAIAGVINLITKRQFTGLSVRGENGLSSRDDAPEHRFSATAGKGDISRDGYNAYISGFYYYSDTLKDNQRPYPYNSSDNSGICYQGTCGANNIQNGVTNGVYNGTATATGALSVRPYDATNTTPQGRYQLLSGCGGLPSYTLTAADLAANPSAAPVVCQDDRVKNYGVIQPKLQRYGLTGHFVKTVGDSSEIYGEVNWVQSISEYTGGPAVIRSAAPTGIDFPQYSTASNAGQYAAGSGALTLPVLTTSGALNPNNPFAAQGEVARIIGRLPNIDEFNETISRTIRANLGIKGTAFGDWQYRVDAVANHTSLNVISEGYVYIQHLLNVVADGSYNFVNLAANSAAQNAYLAPTQVNHDSSKLYQAQANITGTVFQLPGGPAQLGLGGTVYYEAVNDPSGNPDYNGPTERYFVLNAFGSVGHRTVESAFGEIKLPVLTTLDLSAAARYDHYSTGQSAFSPKASFKYTPISQITFRGSWSRGFRIPSFAESNSLPTTGYVTIQPGTLPASFLAQYGCTPTTTSKCDSYITNNSYGLTTVGTAGLKPEKSRSFNAGVVLEPVKNIQLSVDYYNIMKTNAITAADSGPAVADYYAGTPVPAGQTVIPGAVDPNHPNATPLLGFVQVGFVNATRS